MAVFILLVLLALLLFALERSHRRRPRPSPRLAGSVDRRDRDLERVRAELRAAAGGDSVGPFGGAGSGSA